jgi:membrane protein implicated in regulation of membrane protease activity
MPLFYLSVFLIGLVLGVYAMIRGVERVESGHGPELDAMGRPIAAPRVSLAAPRLGAFATVFGITAYALLRSTAFGVPLQIAIAIVAALLGTMVATRAVARWARQAAQEDVADERYLLQGHPAQVIAAIAPNASGKISYVVGARQFVVSAESLDGTPVAVGTEVVIDRLENGVAFVEPWVQVEQRL